MAVLVQSELHGAGYGHSLRTICFQLDGLTAVNISHSLSQGRIHHTIDRCNSGGNHKGAKTIGSKGQIQFTTVRSNFTGVIFHGSIVFGVLNAQFVIGISKSRRQFHRNNSRCSNRQFLIILHNLCIFRVTRQLDVICFISSRCYNAILRSDIQRQRLILSAISSRFYLKCSLNVQGRVLQALCLCCQILCLCLVNCCNLVTCCCAEGRYGNRLSCIFNCSLVAFGNFIYIDFRLCNSRLNYNRTGISFLNYLVVITELVAGYGNIAICNKVCACTLSLVVSRIEVCKIATLNSNISSAIFISRIYAVNNKVVTIRAAKCFCIKIAIIDGQFAFLYLYRSATTVVFTPINGQLCVFDIDCIATIPTCINTTGCCFKCGICSNIQCNKVCVVIAHVVRTVNGMLIQIQSDGLSNR